MGERRAGSQGRAPRAGRSRRGERLVEGGEEAAAAREAPEAGGRERMLSALGNQGVQRLLGGRGVQRYTPPGAQGEDSEEAVEAEIDAALPDSDSASEEQAPEADIYELSPEVISAGPVVDVLVRGAAGDLEAGGPGAEERAQEKESEALTEVDGVKAEVEGYGSELLTAHLHGLRQSLLLDATIIRPYVGEDAVGLDSAQNHLRNVSALFAGDFAEESADEMRGGEELPEVAPEAG